MGTSDRNPDEGAPRGPGAGRILLAREPSIRLGALKVDPPRRSIIRDDGREEIVEPRVMQVLVALHRAGGRVVSRDDLVMSCWHGVVVGEDAITRVMSQLRRLSEGIGAGDFRIETITKVGYRLAPGDRTQPLKAPGPGLLEKPIAEVLLAVLAFDNLSGNPELAYFSDGLSEEILQTVACGAELKVIGRSSSFQFRGAGKAAKNIAGELNATHVLDGSVRQSGGRLRIGAHLIECATETTLWADRFDRDLTDVFALQDEIAGAVATALETTFAPSRPIRTIDPEAYDLYLRALAMGSTEGKTALLERAVALAPDFAAAWADLSRTRTAEGRMHNPRGMPATEWAKAQEEAQRAIQLDPRSGPAWVALSDLQPAGAYAKRESLLKRGLAEARGADSLLAPMAAFCASVGRRRDALAAAERAYQLDRLQPSAVHWYALCLADTGEHERSLALFATGRARWPDADVFSAPALGICAFSGDWASFDAIAAEFQGATDVPRNVRRALAAGRALRDPNPEARRRVLARLEEQLATSGAVPAGPLVLAYHLGLREEAFDLAERSSFDDLSDPRGRSPGGWATLSVIFSLVSGLTPDPRFVKLCSKLALCDYWMESGLWPDCADEVPYDFRAEVRKAVGARNRPKTPS
jgi:adenylate cyclase